MCYFPFGRVIVLTLENEQFAVREGFQMAVVVVVHRLKNFDEWFKLFKADPPPKIGRWRVLRGSEDRNRVHVVGEVAASEVKAVKDFIASPHMQDVFKRVRDVHSATRIHLARRAITLVARSYEGRCLLLLRRRLLWRVERTCRCGPSRQLRARSRAGAIGAEVHYDCSVHGHCLLPARTR